MLGIERDRNGLGMAGSAGADHLVACRVLLTAGIAGNGFGDAFGVLINRLHTPEAATRQHCRLQSTGWDSVGCRSWDNDRLLGCRGTPRAQARQRNRR